MKEEEKGSEEVFLPRPDLGKKVPYGLLPTTSRDRSGHEGESITPGAGDYDPRG